MENSQTYDFVIIGGGQAGIPLAYALAGDGRSVALAESKYLGGSCVNYGCSPTKAAIASARVAHQARRAPEFGLEIPDVRVDFPGVLERAKGIVEMKRSGLYKGFEGSGNPVLIEGHARFEEKTDDGFRLSVGERSVVARQVVINTGAKSSVPPIGGLENVEYISSENWLDHTELPEHLAVVGGGYIGLEMAQFYLRMGSRVTVVVGNSGQVLGNEDDDVAEAMKNILEEEGIEFVFEARAEKVEKSGGGISLTLDTGRGINCSDILVATGRKPNTDGLGLENIGLETGDGGVIEVDERLATSVEGVWAAGDVRGGPMFTHTSYDDNIVLASQITGDGSRTTDRVVPYAVFTDPDLGRAGMTEKEAREAGYDIEVMTFDVKNDGKATEIGETKGLIKVVADKSNDRILGAAVLAHEGAELVHTYIALMNADAPYTVIRDAVHIHPTISESIQSVVA
ncbi:MAG: mercuric reductase [Actinomycetota bacterium]|nr:mercuric reductase [Actinomycetota bacterium]